MKCHSPISKAIAAAGILSLVACSQPEPAPEHVFLHQSRISSVSSIPDADRPRRMSYLIVTDENQRCYAMRRATDLVMDEKSLLEAAKARNDQVVFYAHSEYPDAQLYLPDNRECAIFAKFDIQK